MGKFTSNIKALIPVEIKKAARRILFSWIKSRLGEKEARSILMEYSPKPDGKCYANNKLDIQYDLQIVIPAYNAEKWIEECLISVFSQEFDYKVLAVIVNDGSTDNTGSLIKSIASEYESKKNLTIEIINQNNKGLSGARNTALRVIKGKYIMLVDSDDILPENTIQTMLDKANKYEADILQGSWYDFCNEKNNPHVYTEGENDISGYPWGKLIHNSLFKNFQFPEGYWFEDTPLSFILQGMPIKCVSINDIIYGYRINPDGITGKCLNNKKSFDSYWITEQCLQEFKNYSLEYDQRAYEYLLKQSRTNARRTRLQPKQVREAQFVMTRKLMNDYFTGFQTNDEEMKKIERALKEKRFFDFEMLI